MTNVIQFTNVVNHRVDIAVPQSDDVPEFAVNYRGKAQEMFHVESAPISGPHGVIEGKKGLFVNQANINIVSDKYEVHQPEEIYQQFATVAEQTGLNINRVLTNPHNGGLLISARYDGVQIVGENHDVNVSFYTAHDGKYKTFFTLDLLRMDCMNQVPALYRGKDRHIFAEKHYKNALDIQMLGSLLEHIPESIQIQNEKSNLLIEKPMTTAQFVELFVEHYKLKAEQKQYDSKVAKARSIYENATGQRQLSGSAYKAYQAITYINTHEGRETKMKEENKLTKGAADSLSFMERLLAA